jgi:hypothetical protein
MEFVTAITALQTVVGLAKVAADARDEAKLQAALSDVMAKLVEALSSGIELATRASQLQQDNEKLVQRLMDRENYVLTEVRAGVFALRYKVAEGDPVPTHYICQACENDGKKSVLQLSLNGTKLECKQVAGHTLTVDTQSFSPIQYRGPSGIV